MMRKFLHLYHLPLSRKMQLLNFKKAEFLTRFLYGWRLMKCGRKSRIISPLFWTPEFISLGSNVTIQHHARLEGVVVPCATSMPHIEICDNVSVEQRFHIVAADHLKIGTGTTISLDVLITDVDHTYDDLSRSVMQQPLSVKKTEIGDYCFIGVGVRILAGTVLGAGCCVGANSVLRGKYPPFSVIVGAPGKIIRTMTPNGIG